MSGVARKKVITSGQNLRVKQAVKLRDARTRRETSCFMVEGAREIMRALQCHYELADVFVCAELFSDAAREAYAQASHKGIEVLQVTPEVFAKLAVREQSDGLLAVFKMPRPTELSCLDAVDKPFVLVVAAVEKPGNLGALLRTADGAGVDAVCVTDRGADIYNPLAIRVSLGTVFSVPVIAAPGETLIRYFKERAIKIVAATPHAKHNYFAVNLAGKIAIAVGSEAQGLSDIWLAAADESVRIPMCGIADSLNAASAGAIFLYEACRQRQI